MARITINGITIDPQAQGPALAAADLVSPDSAQSNYIIVQTQGPLTKDQKAQLEGLGATILEYVPENAYICHYAPTDLAPVRALPFVTWANVYLEGFKINPAL